MEHEMKISPSAVRRMRLTLGWSQDQLATVSGVSLRTVQRVETEGFASLNTAVSLAATFNVKLVELQEEVLAPVAPKTILEYSPLFLGLAVMTLAGLSESGRVAGLSMSNFLAAMNYLGALTGALLAAPQLVRLFLQRQYFGAILSVMGTPLVTLLAAGGIFFIVSGRAPNLNLAIFGAAGAAFIALALRELRRSNTEAGA